MHDLLFIILVRLSIKRIIKKIPKLSYSPQQVSVLEYAVCYSDDNNMLIVYFPE